MYKSKLVLLALKDSIVDHQSSNYTVNTFKFPALIVMKTPEQEAQKPEDNLKSSKAHEF